MSCTCPLMLEPGLRMGAADPPPSKSHLHRLLIANFLGGATDCLCDEPRDSEDILATRRCLRALLQPTENPILDCGESGSTLRFIRPIAAALGKRPSIVTSGRLASRPDRTYDSLKPGVFELPGNVSSQFATGLLFALPLLDGDSEINFTTPLESRGYVDLTCEVLKASSVSVIPTERGFFIPGRQCYISPSILPELDWSSAAFWIAMNHLGSRVQLPPLPQNSFQPDRKIVSLLEQEGGEKDMSACPDLFPVLAVVAGAQMGETTFVNIKRLRLKESDRVAAVSELLEKLGVKTEESENTFRVYGVWGRFKPKGGIINTHNDHRIAMAAAVAATVAERAIVIDNPSCSSKSYPEFFPQFLNLEIRGN